MLLKRLPPSSSFTGRNCPDALWVMMLVLAATVTRRPRQAGPFKSQGNGLNRIGYSELPNPHCRAPAERARSATLVSNVVIAAAVRHGDGTADGHERPPFYRENARLEHIVPSAPT